MTAAKKLKHIFTGTKHGNWYVVEGDKDLVEESTKGKFFLVVGERLRKYLASARLLLISCFSRENSAIWSQFRPKLQNLVSHDSLQGFF